MEPELQDPLELTITAKEEEMATANQGLAAELIGQSMGQLSGTAAVAQNNFVTVNKALDLDFIEGKRVIGLTEAVGVREVSSAKTPAGPNQG